MLNASAAAGSVLGMMATRAVSTSAAAASALPAVASKSSSGGLAAMFGFGSSRIDVPLSEPLPAVTKPLKGNVPSAAPTLQTTSLDAGTKVIAVETASPMSSVALVFEAGSAYENDAQLGASKILEAMAFKSTANRTTFRLTRELEKIGAITTANAGRDYIAYTISAPKLHTPEIVEMLVDSVMNARLTYWETAETIDALKSALAKATSNPTNVVSDALHRAAFEGSLGQPLHLDASLIDGLTGPSVKAYLDSVLSPSRAVLAGAGVGADEFKQLANPLVPSRSASGTGSSPDSSKYVGGSLNVLAPTSPYTYVGLAIEAKGGVSNAKSAAAAAVVSALLDVSRSVLPRASKESDVFRSATGFSNMYKSTGLVGLVASTAPSQASQLVDAMVSKVEGLAKPLNDAQLKLAKQIAISSYKAQLSNSTGLAATMAPALLLAGKFNPADFPAAVESLTAADVAAFVSSGLKAGPTMVTYGSMSTRIPRYDTVIKRLQG